MSGLGDVVRKALEQLPESQDRANGFAALTELELGLRMAGVSSREEAQEIARLLAEAQAADMPVLGKKEV